MSRAAFSLACIALTGPLLSCAAPPISGAPLERARVEFSYDAVTPATVHITADGNVTWVNVAPESQGYVIFPETITTGFVCGDKLSPYFHRADAGYISLAITGDESENVELPCALKPGSYPYEIWVMGAGVGELSGSGPGRKLSATIVVE